MALLRVLLPTVHSIPHQLGSAIYNVVKEELQKDVYEDLEGFGLPLWPHILLALLSYQGLQGAQDAFSVLLVLAAASSDGTRAVQRFDEPDPG